MPSAVMSKELVWHLLEALPADRAAADAPGIVERFGNSLPLDAAEALAEGLESRLGSKERFVEAAAGLAKFESPAAQFVRARLLAIAGRADEAIDAFGKCLAALPDLAPFVRLHRARLLARRDRLEEAAEDLRTALNAFPPYPFFVKSEKLLAKIIESGKWPARRKFKLAVLGSSTTALLVPVLRASCFRCGLDARIYEGPYGAFQQEILDEKSGLYQFRPDVVLILVNSRDLSLPPLGGLAAAEGFAANLRNLWSRLQNRVACHVIQTTFDTPPAAAWGALENLQAEGRRRAIAAANRRLADDLPKGVSLLDADEVALHHAGEFRNDAEWHSAKQYPASNALPIFADYAASHCLAVFGLTAKVLVTDLDNTLWGGVIGEDGVGGIQIGPPSPAGEGYLELQRFAKELQQRGVVLAVCSKNNPADAELPFRKHDSMALRMEDFVAFVANWRDKATNLQAIAEDLSLGLDSFVFLDDSPLERAWVRSKLPQVIVPECGKAPWEMLAALKRGLYFQTLTLTKEDAERHASYRAQTGRRQVEKAAGSLEDFLAGLELTAQQGPVDDQSLVRVTQLINKTNQFNLTTRRYTEEQVAAMARSKDWWCRWFRLADKFGDYGLIGVILAKAGGETWEVDAWLMSCRALGRQMEQFMLGTLLSAARAAGATKVRGQYIPTAKNALVKDLYATLGFDPQGADNWFACDLGAKDIPVCPFIRDASKETS